MIVGFLFAGLMAFVGALIVLLFWPDVTRADNPMGIPYFGAFLFCCGTIGAVVELIKILFF